MGAVVRLPTAAPRKVQQPSPSARRHARQAGEAGGAIARFPNVWKAPGWREGEARREETRALYEAGGLVRSAPFLLIAATIATMPPAQYSALLAQLEVLVDAHGDDVNTQAALAFARQVGPGVSPV